MILKGLIILSSLFSIQGVQDYNVVKKIYCKSSGITSINPLCKLRPISREMILISWGVEVTKKISDPVIAFKFERRTVTNWRHIVDVKDIDYCSYLRMGKMAPFFKNQLDFFLKAYPLIPRRCPVNPGRYYMLNYTIDGKNEIVYPPDKNGNASPPNITQTPKGVKDPALLKLPNGLYKVTINVSSKDDPMVFQIQWQLRIEARLGEEDF